MNIDSNILEESRTHFPIRTGDLVRNVAERTGRGERTIYRRLEKLKREGAVCVLDSKTINVTFHYAAHDEKACYVVVSEMVGIFTHFDEILHDIENKDNEDILRVLDEVLLYKNSYLLNPVQLDGIVSVLQREIQIDYIALHILYEHIINHGVLPRNSTALLKKLRKMVDRTSESGQYGPVRKWAIHILGYYNDDSVLEQLEYDSSLFEMRKDLYTLYTARHTAHVIACNPAALYRMIVGFKERGDDARAEYIDTIRRIALEQADLKSCKSDKTESFSPTHATQGSLPPKNRRKESARTGWWYK